MNKSSATSRHTIILKKIYLGSKKLEATESDYDDNECARNAKKELDEKFGKVMSLQLMKELKQKLDKQNNCIEQILGTNPNATKERFDDMISKPKIEEKAVFF